MAGRTLGREELCGMIDHTCLKPDAVSSDIERLCREAAEYHFKMVAVNSFWSRFCKERLEGTGVHTGAAVSFPLGQTTVETKLFETENAIANGADEIDYVINISKLKEKDYGYIRREMRRIVDLCRGNGVISKVIFENCYLSKEEISVLAEIAKEEKPDFIKTSTGFGTGGATVDDVRLMKKIVGEEVKVKAAGGIRSVEDCRALIAAGAERIGTSSGIKIVQGLDM